LFLAMESYRRRYLLEQTDVVLVGFQSHLNLAPIGSVLLLLGMVSHSRAWPPQAAQHRLRAAEHKQA
jgi:hypothetical protein